LNKNRALYLFLTFAAGALIMIFEIIGARILAPFIGTSFIVWTSLIGFVLASLSLGYYLGGKWIDKKPGIATAGKALLGSALAILWVILIKDDFLAWIVDHVKGLKASSVFAGLVLFSPAGLFLGMVSPSMSRLMLTNIPDAGKTMGSIFAWGSIGSLFGTFLAGFYLLPNFPLTHILTSLQILTSLIAATIFLLEKKWIYLAISMLAVVATLIFSKSMPSEYTYEYESNYNSIKVFPSTDYRSGDSILIMQLGTQRAGGMSLSNRPLPYNYLYFFRLAEHFNPGFKKSLMFGGAAYSFPQYYLTHYPGSQMDVIEIDSATTRVAMEYFGLKNHADLKIYHTDARTYLNRCNTRYDIIFSDAFQDAISLPYQLTTLESVQKQYDILNDNGLVIVNVIQAVEGKSSLFLQAELKTFMQVFPQVYLFADRPETDRTQIQSTIILALKSTHEPIFSSLDLGLDSLLSKRITRAIPLTQSILTDDFAPVESLALKGL
jgi:spermidine synthase